jgi:hypothetical protein
MALPSLRPSRQGRALTQELAVVRELLGRLETKLRENDPERISKEDDQELRGVLQRIGDERLTRLTLAYAICVRGLTAPMASGAWKRELAQEVDEAHRGVLARLETLERLARSSIGCLLLWLQAILQRIFPRPVSPQRPFSPEEDGNLHRAARP